MSTEQSESRASLKLKELVTRRSSIKGQITKYKNYLDKLSKSSYPSDLETAGFINKIR